MIMYSGAWYVYCSHCAASGFSMAILTCLILYRVIPFHWSAILKARALDGKMLHWSANNVLILHATIFLINVTGTLTHVS